MIACSFSHMKFAGRAAGDEALLRVFVGGAFGRKYLDDTDQKIAQRVRGDLNTLLGIVGEPKYQNVVRYPKAMPQYAVGHTMRQKLIENRLAEYPGLHLAGNAFDGVGIPDCIRQGRQAASQASLSSREMVEKSSKA
jgi:oxygen-dependent protoporphyrinogen oxidase